LDRPIRYAVVGTGYRAELYIHALAGKYRDKHQLVCFCDSNKNRMEFHNRVLQERFQHPAIPIYAPKDFKKMIQQEQVDQVIVVSRDDTHHEYIIEAMKSGCNVITEKPMTIDEKKCQKILDTLKSTKQNVRVTFNYRYGPARVLVKEQLIREVIGEIKSVHFEWLLDTRHGADYFRRWHRRREHSGSLLVHKATHHFDLVNWWLQSTPTTVFAKGGLFFYGNPQKSGGERCQDCTITQECPFYMDLSKDPTLEGLYLKAEKEDGYYRDQCVFSRQINIFDDMHLLVQYRNGATMTYYLNAFSPYEGFHISFTGTKGRMEFREYETVYKKDPATGFVRRTVLSQTYEVKIWPHFNEPYELKVTAETSSGHGGGDVRMLEDLFGIGGKDPYARAASAVDGAYSILTGIAAFKSIQKKIPVDVRKLIRI